jgi:hypothetical protein
VLYYLQTLGCGLPGTTRLLAFCGGFTIVSTKRMIKPMANKAIPIFAQSNGMNMSISEVEPGRRNVFIEFEKNGHSHGTAIPVIELYKIIKHYYDTTDDPGVFDSNGNRVNPFILI